MTEKTARKRSASGRFAPGNPGRPQGARNKLTVLAERLLAGDLEAIVTKIVDKAKAGDMVAGKLILDRVLPVPKGRALAFPLPCVTDAQSAMRAFGAVLAAMASGQVTPDEGEAIGKLLANHLRAIDSADIEARLAKLEALVARPSETRQ
jgi:hypothetical protein